jgi:hypothetical protein
MKVEKLSNGQYQVTHKNLTLTQTVTNGHRFNDCTVFDGNYYELISEDDERMKPLFIELHNFKCNE